VPYKVTGDRNVPKGQASFAVDLSLDASDMSSSSPSRKEDGSLEPLEISAEAAEQWGGKIFWKWARGLERLRECPVDRLSTDIGGRTFQLCLASYWASSIFWKTVAGTYPVRDSLVVVARAVQLTTRSESTCFSTPKQRNCSTTKWK
jgi:hypothetical protein